MEMPHQLQDILNGEKSITIIENGDGIDSDDVHAFERHATSEIGY